VEEEQIRDEERHPGRAWLRVCDVAELLGVSRNTVRRWTDAGRLGAHRSPGGHRRYRRTEVEAMLDSLRIEAPEAPDGVARVWKPRGIGGSGEQAAGAERLTSLVDTGQELAGLLATEPSEVPRRLADRLCQIAAVPVCEITSFDDDGAHVLASVCDGACQTARLASIPVEGPRRRLAATLADDQATHVFRGDDPDLDADARTLLDEHGCESLVFAPMYSGKRLTGTVELCTPEHRGLEREAGLAAGFAELAAHFLDTSTVVERLLRQEQAARELVELGGVAARTGDVNELLREVARHLSAALGAACIDIYGLESDGLHCVASAGVDEEYPDYVGTVVPLRDYPLTAASLQSGEPFAVAGPDDPHMSATERESIIADGYSAEFGVPLLAAGRPVGFLDIYGHDDRDPRESLDLIVSAGQMIAGWIENSLLVTDLERQKKLFGELVELGTLTTHAQGTTAQLRSVGAQLLETIEADTVEIYTLRNGRIHYEAGFDRDEDTDQWLGWSDELANYPLTQATLDSHDALIIASRDDPRLSEYERQRFELFNYHSEICLPLMVEDRAIGYVDIFDTKPRDYAEFAAFLRSAAPVIARTLENSLLLEEVRGRAEALRELVNIGELLSRTLELDELVRLVALRLLASLDAAYCDIFRVDGATLTHLAAIGPEGFDDQIVGRVVTLDEYPTSKGAVESGEPLIVTSPDDPLLSEYERDICAHYDIRSYVSLPLQVGGRTIALIDIDDTRERDFSEHLDFIKNVGRLLAGAFEKAFLLERLEEGNRELRDLVEAGLEFGASLDLSAILDAVASRMCLASNAVCCDLWRIAGDTIHGLASADEGVPDPGFRGTTYPLEGLNASEHVMQTLKPLGILDVATDPHAGPLERSEWAKFGFSSGYLVPLVAGGETVGLAVLFSREPREWGDPQSVRGLAQFAAQAIANASLFAQIDDTARQLRQLADAGLEFGSSLDLDEVMLSVGARICGAADAACCEIYSIEGDLALGLVSVDGSEPDEAFAGTRYRLSEMWLSSIALERLEPLSVADIRVEPLASDFERQEWGRFGFCSGLLLPLVTRGEIVGLSVVYGTEPRDFGELPAVRGLAQIAAQAIANASVYERLDESARRMALMTEASMEFSASLDLDETLFKVARRLCAVVDVPDADINVVQPDGRLMCVTSILADALDPAWIGQYEDLADYAIHAEVLESGAPAVVRSLDDPRLNSQERALSEDLGEKSWLSLPLIARDKAVGIIDLTETRRERAFTDDEIATALSVCQVAALAIDNAAVYDRLEESARRVQALLDTGRAIGSTVELEEVLAHVTREACLALDVSATSIYDFDARHNRYVYRAAYEVVPQPETPGEIGQSWILTDYPGDRDIMFSDRPVIHHLSDPDLLPDRREAMTAYDEHTVLSVPLRFGDERLGILRFDVYEHERRFTDDEIELARGIGEQAAVAIANGRSHAQLEEALARMTLMTEAGLEFSSSLDLDETLLAVGRRLCDAVGVPNCDINVLRGDRVECLMSVVDGQCDLSWTGTSSPIADYSAGHEVIYERQVAKFVSIDDPRVTEAGRVSRLAYGEKSWMTVPLIVKDRVLGMIDLSETRFERDFSDDEIAAVQAICRVAALAIDNADLFADVQARTAETDMLNAIAAKATATIGLHEMILNVSDELRQVVPFARSSLALLEKGELVFYRPHSQDVARLDLSARGEAAVDFHKRLRVENVVRLRLPEDGGIWADFPDLDGVRSAIAIALQADDRIIGALNLLSSQDDGFAGVDSSLLTRVGTQVSLAIKNALLYRDIKGMHLNNLKALSAALNAKDYYTLGHAARVSAYMVLLGQKLGWPAELLSRVEEAAYLHDIGKISISDRVLLKPGKLNAEEWKSMKQHPVFSAEIIHTLFDEDLVLGVRHHHERWDGEGYPDGLEGIHVPVIARAMCVVDAYDAMSFRRPYRNALGADACLAELQRCRGAQFDPELCDAFIEVLGELDERRKTAARIAAEAAARIDPAKHALLLSPEDEGRPEYAEIAGILREVRDANPPTHFLTTQARLARRYVVVVDGEENERERSPLGADIFPDEVLQVLPQALAGEDPQVNALFADQFGVWVTGLAPIRDAHGETIAVVAADLPPFAGAESGGLRMASQDSLASILQTAAVHSSQTDIDTISDGLTGLYNHRYLHDRLREELIRAGEAEAPLSLLFCDIDHFARFNEELGHRAGDNALRSVAHVLEQSIRNVDLAARFGGEEFVVALLETDARGAFEVAERIRERIRETWIAPSQDPLSISIGVVTFPGDGQSKEELLDKADWAMHVAKRRGRNRVVAFSPSDTEES